MSGNYSILFMKDDGGSKRIRMRLSTARFFLAVLIVLPLLAGASIWLNVYLFRSGQSLQNQIADMRQLLDKQAQTTVRLANLEQYLSRNDPDNLSRLVASPGPEVSLLAELGNVELPLLPAENVDTNSAESVATQDTVEEPAASDGSTPEAAAATGEENGPEAVDQPAPTDTPEPAVGDAPVDGSSESSVNEAPIVPGELRPEILTQPPVDTGYTRVENLTARQVGARSLRISFDLFNNGKISPLAGYAAFELVLSDGRVYPLGSQGDTNYRIANMKRIVGNPSLPAEVSDTADARIRVNVYAHDELVYRSLVPLQR